MPASAQAQENGATSSAAVDNDSTAGQFSEQTQSVEGSTETDSGDEASGTPDEGESRTEDDDGSGIATSNASATVIVDQDVDAAAAAEQSSPTNVSVVVAVDQPESSHPAVMQENASTASASSNGTVATEHRLPDEAASTADIAQSVEAEADVTQTGAANVNVEVRVDTPGDTGAVAQTNSASATATAVATGNGAANQSADAGATVDQTAPGNTNVSVRVDSPGDNGPVTQVNAASASATADADAASADAQANQDGARNTNLSIRIDSPGEDGEVTQVNESTESTSTPDGDTLDVTTDGTSTSIDLDVTTDGDSASAPSVWIWAWIWTWDGEADPDLSDAQATMEVELAEGNDWDWDWSPPADDETPEASQDASSAESDAPEADAESTATSETESPNAGMWEWTWAWDQDGDGSSDEWSWTWSTEAPCDCTWQWTWIWTWSSPPTESESPAEAGEETDASDVEVDGSTEQTNEASASATASATVEVAQSIDQSAEAESEGDSVGSSSTQAQEALQETIVEQDVTALAGTTQTDAQNLDVSVGGEVTQLNSVTSTAEATASSLSVQEIVQIELGTKSEQSQWAGQATEVTQHAWAGASGAQAQAENVNRSNDSSVEQANDSVASALASVASEVGQLIVQDATGEAATQVQQAGQVALVLQSHEAAAQASLVDVRNDNVSEGGAFAQANLAGAQATSTAQSLGLQAALQELEGSGVVQSQESWQVLEVVQGGVAVALAEASHLTNVNVFLPDSESPAPSPSSPTGPDRLSGSSVGHTAGSSPLAPSGSLLQSDPKEEPTELALTPAELTIEPAIGAPQGAQSLEQGAGVLPALGRDRIQVSASLAGPARAFAVRWPVPDGRKAADAASEEAAAPLPAPAPVDSGVTAGSLHGGSSSSGPAATVARLAIRPSALRFPVPSPAVRRPAVIGSALERPG